MPCTHPSHTSFHFGMHWQTLTITMARRNTCLQWQTHRCTQTNTHLVPKGICPQPKSFQLLRKNSSISSVEELTKYIYTCTHTYTPPTHAHTLWNALILSQSVTLIGVLMILWESGILQATIEWLPALYFSFKVEIHPQTLAVTCCKLYSTWYSFWDSSLMSGFNLIFLACGNAIL